MKIYRVWYGKNWNTMTVKAPDFLHAVAAAITHLAVFEHGAADMIRCIEEQGEERPG